MAEKIDPKNLPSSDWDWLEKNELWDRNAAAAWLSPLAGIDLILLNIEKTKQLRLSPNKQLGITAEHLKGENLIHLRGFGKLKKLSAPRNLDDIGLEYIGQLGKLTTLYLTGDQFTDAGLKHLSNLAKLKNFETEWLPSGGEAIKILAKLPNISSMGLNQTELTDEDLIPLKDSKLKVLNIGGKNITGQSLQYIGQITSLEELMLGSYAYTQKITDESLKQLSGLVNLKRLTLQGTEVTAKGLAYLEPLKSLKKLRLNRSLCGTPEAKALKAKIPGLAIGDNK